MPILYLLFVVFIIAHGEGQDECPELRCREDGPPIRFPFKIEGRHPHRCGSPGFHISCTRTNDTVLQLPTSVKLFVKKIDYISQVIKVFDPARCFPASLRGLNLSSSPIQIKGDDYRFFLYNYALFKCSPTTGKKKGRISCLSGPSHHVFALFVFEPIRDLPMLSCSKMYSLEDIPDVIMGGGGDILHLKWDSPDCRHCEEEGKNCGLKNNNSTQSQLQCFPRPTTENSKGPPTKVGATVAGAIFGSFLLLGAIFALYRAYSNDKVEKEYRMRIENFLEDYRNCKPTRYSYADIKRITNQFNEKLGQGAFGTVFKGKLSNEIYVAVKILNTTSKGNGEEFINEVGTMGTIHHVNVVRLVGFCADGFRRALVYEFLPNGSLDKLISSADNKSSFLGWDKLQDIAIGIAKGIEYLHQGCDQRILHFDIKPQNILLDHNFNPKTSDFGLAKLCSKDQSAVSMTTARGTIGYIAPEVFSKNFGNVSYKADVYSFGMLLLEIVGGRNNVDFTLEKTGQIYFPEWIYNLLEQKEELRVFIEDDEEAQIAKKLAIVGLWCIQWHPIDRPSMKFVVQMLEREGSKLKMPPNPFGPTSLARANATVPIRSGLDQELEIIPESELL